MRINEIIGSRVQHNFRQDNASGVVVAATKHRLWVQTVPGETVVWYRVNVTEV